MNVRSVAVATLFFSLARLTVSAETAEQWIGRARAYLGSEEALNRVTSIHYTGALEGIDKVPSPADKTKLIDQQVHIPTEIVFQKPYQQRITLTRADSIDTTALDGYDAWNKVFNPKNPAQQWRITLLRTGQIKNLRANTWENLNFFLGLEKKGGSVQLDGDADVDGVKCVKLVFMHDASISFQRFFDKATGRLVKTVIENGTEIREEGELMAGGIRFPHKIVQKETSGKVTTIIFEKVELNQQFPAADFAVPSMQMMK